MEIFNSLEVRRLYQLLNRFLKKWSCDDGEEIFSAEEEEKLRQALDLDAAQLEALLHAIDRIFRRCALSPSAGKAAQLARELEEHEGVASDRAEALLRAWADNLPDVMERLKSAGASQKQLVEVNWTQGLTLAHSHKANLKEPVALFEFGVRDAAKDGELDRVTVEFSHEELFGFFQSLEQVQTALDGLSS